MSKPDNFYDVIEELDFITHVPTRLILAHLVCFYGVEMYVAYLLWMHYEHCNQESIEGIEAFVADGSEGDEQLTVNSKQ